MIDLTINNQQSQTAPHSEAVELLSKQLLTWFKQIRELDAGDFPDRAARSAALRKKCQAVEQSIKELEKRSQKSEISNQANKGE